MTTEEQKAITKNTTITLGAAIAIMLVIAGFIFKAGQTLTEFDVVKQQVLDIRTEMQDYGRKLDQLLRK